MTKTAASAPPTTDEYAEKLFNANLGAFETLSVYVGDRLGWFRSLNDDGPATPAELAERTGTQERYCREWLEMQAAYGTLTVRQDAGDVRRFVLPPGPAEVLTDENSLSYLAPLPRFLGAIGPQLPRLLDVYRAGGGVSWAEFGEDAREGQAALNRPWFERELPAALSGCAEVHTVLSRSGARIADVGCGGGWSTLALAGAYPTATVVGIDVDQPSLDQAKKAAAEAGLSRRVSFQLAGAETLQPEEEFDAVFAFECVHDMPRPVEVLAAIRSAVRPDGLVVVMDEAVEDEFTAPAGDVDQLMYGFSLFVCLPDGLSSSPSAATGTVFRRPVLTDYALRAGYSDVSVLPIDDFGFFRFYRLR